MKVKLGQNFLIDNNIAKREVEYADIKKSDIVLEIGPGKGILTKILAKKAKKVIAIEYDKNLFEYLYKILPENVELINNDGVKVDFKNIHFNKIVSNLPFQISSPITFKFLEEDFEDAILIYQEDFAKRMVGLPGTKNYSHLSVHLYYKAYCEILERISKNSFNPKPKIDACIVKMIPLKKTSFNVKNEKFFLNLSRTLFNHRRKMIRKTIKDNYNINNLEHIPFKRERVEDLSPEEIGRLSDILFDKIE